MRMLSNPHENKNRLRKCHVISDLCPKSYGIPKLTSAHFHACLGTMCLPYALNLMAVGCYPLLGSTIIAHRT
ncbi:hypothetical protein BH10PSE19_BH10PSE19_17640 [soil metagenome]